MSIEVEHTTFRNLTNHELERLADTCSCMPRHVLEAFASEVMRRFVILDQAVDRAIMMTTPQPGSKPRLVHSRED